MSKNNYKGIDPFIINQVRYHARSLIRHPAIHGMEVEDIEQELMLDVLSRTQAYDPEKASWRTFVDRILNHKIADLIEEAKAQKRGGGIRPLSLDAMLENTEGEEDEFPDPAGNPERGMHLAIDLNRVVQSLFVASTKKHAVKVRLAVKTSSMRWLAKGVNNDTPNYKRRRATKGNQGDKRLHFWQKRYRKNVPAMDNAR